MIPEENPVDIYQQEETPEEVNIYEQANQVGYASASMPNNTLTMMLGSEQNDYEQVHNDIISLSPAYVAARKAQELRKEDIELWRNAATVRAGQGDTPAVLEAIKQIQNLTKPTEESFVNDSATIARATIDSL